jgi:subtilisin family serine protease
MDRNLNTIDRALTVWGPKAALRLVRLPELMDITAGDPGITVALIDGPIALDRPELTIQCVRSLNGGKRDQCVKPESVACTHGTRVAGLLNAKRAGSVPGICPGCTLVVRSIFSEATNVPQYAGVPSATVTELAAALIEVIEGGARVINLSVGVTEAALRCEPALNLALEQATRRGAIIIAAAGNQGTLGSSALTRHPWVTTTARPTYLRGELK